MRILLAIIPLLVALPGAAYAADILVNNGDDCSNPANVIDDMTYLFDTVHVRNVGCGTPDPGSPCPSPGDATEVCVTWGAVGGGAVDQLHLYDSSSVTVSGGGVGELRGYASSTVTVSDGEVWGSLHAYDSSGVTMSGGEVDELHAYDDSTVTMSGGTVGDNLYASDSATVTIVGRNFEVDGAPVPYGDLTAQTGTLTGTLASGDPINNVFDQGGGLYTGTITLAAPPVIPALPKWGYVALAGGLIVVGVEVMRRQAG